MLCTYLCDVILSEEDLKEIKTYRSISGVCVRANLTKYQEGVYYLGVTMLNMLPSCIKMESDNPKKYKLILQNLYMKIPFILWMNILNFKKVKFIYL